MQHKPVRKLLDALWRGRIRRRAQFALEEAAIQQDRVGAHLEKRKATRHAGLLTHLDRARMAAVFYIE